MRNVAMRRAKPELVQEGFAEAEKLAGVSARARGGVTRGAEGLSPETIQAKKAQTSSQGDPWEMGTKMRKKRNEGDDAESLDLYDLADTAGMLLEAMTGKPFSEWSTKMFEKVFELQSKYGEATGAKEIIGYGEDLKRVWRYQSESLTLRSKLLGH